MEIGYGLKDVDKWLYKSKKEVEALPDHTLLKLEQDVCSMVRLLKKQQMGLGMELFWLLMTVPGIVKDRGLKSLPILEL